MCTTQPIGELDFQLKSQATNKENLQSEQGLNFFQKNYVKTCMNMRVRLILR